MKVRQKFRQASVSMVLTDLLLSLLATDMPQVALASDGDDAAPQVRFAILAGVHDWSSLGDLQSAVEGSFESTGVNAVIAWHRDIVEFQHITLLAGGELGFFTNESSLRGSLGELTSRGIHLVPSLKFAFGRQRNIHADAGVGLYSADFAELDCGDFGCVEVDRTWSEYGFGGLVGAGVDFDVDGRWAFALEAKIHFVDLGPVSGLDTSPQKLNGPIYMLQIGAAF